MINAVTLALVCAIFQTRVRDLVMLESTVAQNHTGWRSAQLAASFKPGPREKKVAVVWSKVQVGRPSASAQDDPLL